jgi:hypothetical protein
MDHGLDSSEDKVPINMVFELPDEFQSPDMGVMELALGTKTTVFQKPKRLGMHMQPLFVMGYLQGKMIHQIM